MTPHRTTAELLAELGYTATPDGEYQNRDGVVVGADVWDVIHDVFGWCGCGCPDPARQIVFDVFRCVYDKEDPRWVDEIPGFPRRAPAPEYAWPSVAVEYFFWYWADARDLMEHGTAVPGWLTEKGRTVLELLAVVSGVRA